MHNITSRSIHQFGQDGLSSNFFQFSKNFFIKFFQAISCSAVACSRFLHLQPLSSNHFLPACCLLSELMQGSQTYYFPKDNGDNEVCTSSDDGVLMKWWQRCQGFVFQSVLVQRPTSSAAAMVLRSLSDPMMIPIWGLPWGVLTWPRPEEEGWDPASADPIGFSWGMLTWSCPEEEGMCAGSAELAARWLLLVSRPVDIVRLKIRLRKRRMSQ